MSEEFDIVTIRLRKGDRDRLRTYFHPMDYNKVIRGWVSKLVDNIEARGRAIAQFEGVDVEINTEELDDDASS